MADFEGFIPFGRPASPDEIEQYKEQLKQDVGVGNAHYDVLPSFNPNATCPKCGYDHTDKAMRMGFQAEGSQPKEAGEHECMLVQCRRCGYRQAQKCKDANHGDR